MPSTDITDATAVVTRASRGFGPGIAAAVSRAGAQVVGVAKDHAQLQDARAELGDSVTPISADAADQAVAIQLIDTYYPHILVLNVGVTPVPRPIQHQSRRAVSRNWDVDVQHVIYRAPEAFLAPSRLPAQ
jgi:NADP-dependent 3-hydroxy acid dehydrogenase YdfG